MTAPAASCPNCGAPIVFRWSSSVQTVCEFCKSVLVRTDVDLKKIGEVADLPPDSSPIQLTTEGIYGNKAFTVIGRIIYDYEQGTWNEWHIVMNDGTSWWLSDAQDEYAVSCQAPGRTIPDEGQAQVGKSFAWDRQSYTVTTLTKAHFRGVQGELPFEYWDKGEATFVDLRSESGRFATLDYSDTPPVLYLGEMMEFDALRLKNLRSFEGWS